jgi:hypothetical protein
MAKSAPKPNTGPPTKASRYAPPEALVRPRNGAADGDPLKIASLEDRTGGGLCRDAYVLPEHKPSEPA